jgi:hypothetical protein
LPSPSAAAVLSSLVALFLLSLCLLPTAAAAGATSADAQRRKEMSISSKLVELHSLLLDWPSPPKDEADRQSLWTCKTRVLQLIDDAEVKKSIAEGKDMDKEVRTHALRAQLSSICIDSFSAAQ